MKVGFPVFFHIWAERQGWKVPDFHYAVCDWLEKKGKTALLMMPRGHAKSSMLDVYNAWRLYLNQEEQIFHQGATDPDAYKVSRGTERVLEAHPLTAHVKKSRGETQRWWVNGSQEVRYGNMYCRGILSTVTGHRATEIQNDDVEVPQNIATPDAREKLRFRLSEQTHVLVPGGSKLFVGTPHTFDSIYKELEESGADCLILRAFDSEARFEDPAFEYRVPFKPEYAFDGIGKGCLRLTEGVDYDYRDGVVVMRSLPRGLVDFYAGALWPERFTPDVMAERRKECRTLNEWDSQYMLRSKPIHDIRLNPDKIEIYEAELNWVERNDVVVASIGNARINYVKTYWDVAEGKATGDASVISVVLQDTNNNLYWHDARRLLGGIRDQCATIKEMVELYQLPHIIVETNGIGKFAEAFLRETLAGTGCSVVGRAAKGNKNERIIAAFETPISGGIMWAHERVEQGGAFPEMKSWNPTIKDQPDDYLDSGAGAILGAPVLIGTGLAQGTRQKWQPGGGTYDLQADF